MVDCVSRDVKFCVGLRRNRHSQNTVAAPVLSCCKLSITVIVRVKLGEHLLTSTHKYIRSRQQSDELNLTS